MEEQLLSLAPSLRLTFPPPDIADMQDPCGWWEGTSLSAFSLHR